MIAKYYFNKNNLHIHNDLSTLPLEPLSYIVLYLSSFKHKPNGMFFKPNYGII